MDRKDIFMSGFKSKIGYSFTYKDLTEFEAIIDFYEQQFKKQQKIIDKSILKEIALKEDIKNIIKILEKNCDDLEATEEEFDSLDRWQGLQVVELEQGSDNNE